MAEPAIKPLRDFTEGLDPALLRHHAREAASLQEEAKRVASDRQNLRKRLKADGFDLDAYDLAMKLQKLDPVEAVIRLNRTINILRFLNAPVGAQLSFMDVADDNAPISEEQRIARWKSDGANAYVMGKREIDCPHAANMPAGQAWLSGYRDAEFAAVDAKSRAELAEPNEIDDIGNKPKKGRGRPAGSKNKPKLAAVDGERVDHDPAQADIEDAAPTVPENDAPAAPAPEADLPPDLDDLPAPPIADEDAPPAPPVA